MMGAKRAVCGAIVIGFALGIFGLAGCEGDDTNPARPYTPGSTGGLDATTEGGEGTDSGVQSAEFCARYGGYTNVQKMANDIITAAAADCRISAEFVSPPSGITHVRQCFEKQLGTYFGCPGVVYDKDAAGKTCRTMTDAHKNLGLRKADFDAFIGLSSGVLHTDGLSDSDRAVIVQTMNGLQQQVAPRAGSGNADCTCPNLIVPGTNTYCGLPEAGTIDAGNDGGVDSGNDSGGTIADAADEG